MRDRLFDVSARAQQIDTTMYDREEIVARYDTVKAQRSGFANAPSTLKSWYELEFLAYLEHARPTSIIDVGCGAGAFFHLLTSRYGRDRFHYFGIDTAPAQVAVAQRNFGERHFAVGDVSTMKSFARYDVVHSYSVLSFMSSEKQLAAIERMCRDSKLLVDTGFTLPHPEFAPRSFYREYADKVFTPIFFPYLGDLPVLPGHTITIEVQKYRAPLLVNRLGRDRSIAPIEQSSNSLTRSYLKIIGRPTSMLSVKIRPDGWSWEPSEEMRAATKDEVFEVYSQMLCDHANCDASTGA